MKGQNISLQKVHINDLLWNYYMNLIVDTTLPYQYEVLNDRVPGAIPSGAFYNFRVAAGEEKGEHVGRCFQDSDIGKWIEACAYSLNWKPNAELESRVDEAIALLGRAQREDGYLNTYFMLARPGLEFTNLYECHELYTFGHLCEAAVAWYEATGKRNFLEIVCRYADLILERFGPGENQIHGYDGHQEVELAFVKLYRATGDQRYLKMAQYQLNERGKLPNFFEQEWEKRELKYYFYDIPRERNPGQNGYYNQSYKPPVEQSDAVGHAVRMTYMCIGMSEVAREAGDREMLAACKRLWDSIVNRNMYITGAVGSTHHGEAFSFDYDLPNDRVYGESCASVGMVMFAHSMLLNESNSQYADVMERVLYNAILAAVALDGKHFFYVNPLEVFPEACEKDKDMAHVKPLRQKWFGTACCPPNLARLLASIGRYIYHRLDDTIYVDLYIANETHLQLPNGQFGINMRCNYPWEGSVQILVYTEHVTEAGIALRIPGWCQNWHVKVNRQEQQAPCVQNGYVLIHKQFTNGDMIEIEFSIVPRYLCANPLVRQDNGKVAIAWGPIIYCAEEVDNGKGLAALSVDVEQAPEFLPCEEFPVHCLTCNVPGSRQLSPDNNALYYETKFQQKKLMSIRMIPYFLWGNRNGEQAEEMRVWLME